MLSKKVVYTRTGMTKTDILTS